MATFQWRVAVASDNDQQTVTVWRSRFDRYKSKKSGDEEEGSAAGDKKKAVLAWPAGADKSRVSATAASTFLVRDLITTPCEHMGPQHLEVGLGIRRRASFSLDEIFLLWRGGGKEGRRTNFCFFFVG